MGWLETRNIIIAVAAISALFLFGLMKQFVGIDINTPLLGTSITPAIAMGVGMIYIIFAFYKSYI